MPDMVKRFSQIFADQVFHVPDYQRGYAWEQRQWDDLLEDLELLTDGRTHFTGTLVLRARNDGSGQILDQHMHAYDSYDIIDGQQRLTTVVILLKAIHDEMQTFPQLHSLASRLQETYLHHVDRNGQPFTKLTLNADSQNYFSDNILDLRPGISGPTIRSHERLLGAHQHFVAYLLSMREKLGDSYPESLQTLYGKVTLQLNFIVYPVDDELDAGTIFETMNDRGKPLTELEKVKNYLLYISGKLDLPVQHDLNIRINETWKLIYERLMSAGLAGRGSEDQLLRSHWLMAYDYDASRWQNARSIKLRFNLRKYQNQHAKLLDEIKGYLHSLQDATAAYCDIFRPWHPGALNDISDFEIREKVRLWGKKLTRLGVSASFLPLLMAVRTKATDNGKTYLNTVQLLEKYSFRVFSWRRARSNSGQTKLFQLGNRYFYNPNSEWLSEEISHLILYYCPDETFNERFQRESENWYNWGDISYFLYEYEHHLAGGRPVQLTWETLNARPKSSSIEHILPQTPQANYWLERFTPEQRQRWTHDLANLTLTYDNSGLSNKPFTDKKGLPGQKGCYADSPLFIERELAQVLDWTVDALKVRREQIVAWAQERWRVTANPRPSSKSKTMEDKFDEAEEVDMRSELEAIHAAAERLGMWPTVRKGIQYRHPHNYRLSTIVVYIETGGMTVYFHHRNFAAYPGVAEVDAAEILGVNDGWNYFRLENLGDVVAALERFYRHLQEKE
jgi:hypothetical protein